MDKRPQRPLSVRIGGLNLMKTVGVVVVVLICLRMIGANYFSPAVTSYLSSASFCTIIVLIVLALMRRTGRL